MHGLRVNGVATCVGSVKAATVNVNGTGTFQGPVQVSEMSVNGDASVRAGLGVGNLVVRGNLTVDGGVAARDIELKGVMRVRGDLTTGSLRGEGTLEAGAIRADSFDSWSTVPRRSKSVEASRVTLRAPGSLAAAVMFWADKRFTVESIRASEVWAEHTSANVISAGQRHHRA